MSFRRRPVSSARRRWGVSDAIKRRRMLEDKRTKYIESLQKDFQLNHIAHWEKATSQTIARNGISALTQKYQAQHRSQLDARRQQLATLLGEDHEQERQEIIALQETSSERHARMASRARKLKLLRAKKQEELVRQLRQHQLRMGCDELRQFDSKQRLLQRDRDRIAQVRDRAAMRALNKKMEEEEDRLRKIENDKRLEKQHANDRRQADFNDCTKEILDQQLAHIHARQRKKKEQWLAARRAHKEKLVADALDAERNSVRQREEKRQKAEGILRYNQQLKKAKFDRLQEEKAADMAMLQKTMAKHKEETSKRAADKVLRRKNNMEYQEYIAQQHRQALRDEKEHDALIQVELDKANKKRDLARLRETLARQTLLKQVQLRRAEQVEALEQKRRFEAHLRQQAKLDMRKHLERQRMYVEMQRAKKAAEQNRRRHIYKTQSELTKLRQDMVGHRLQQDNMQAAHATRMYRSWIEQEKAKSRQQHRV